MEPADLNEMIAFIKNRRTETKPGEYDHFLYGEVLKELQQLQESETAWI